MRTEHDFLGEMNVPDDVYYGVQTMRAMENFHITGNHLDPDFIHAMALVKKAAALANMKTGRLPKKIGTALVQAADEILAGKSGWCRHIGQYEYERSALQPRTGNPGPAQGTL